MRSAILLAFAASLSPLVGAVKPEDFKTCAQSSFCRRLRGIQRRYNESPDTFTSPYSVSDPTSSKDGSWTWGVNSSIYPEVKFELRVDILAEGDGIVRVRMDEVGSKTEWRRYNETVKWALVNTEPALSSATTLKSAKGVSTIAYGPAESRLTLEVQHEPLRITQLRDGVPEVILNDRSLLHMEHFRLKEEAARAIEGEDKADQVLSDSEQMVLQAQKAERGWFEETDKDLWEEQFKQWKDVKPKGPEALSLDISFPGVQHIYGLAEHASPLSLPDTTGPKQHYNDPYRLYNVDIFEYLADSPMALYGAIPLLHAHSSSHSVGVLNLVASDTFVDVEHKPSGVATHWMSESGILDVLLLPGPKPQQLFEQYAVLTGPTPLPPQWSTAYHQCRWNYVDESDVLAVQKGFDAVDIPLDVTWLDIEYAEEHRYFDWNKKYFPDPVKMQEEVASKGRKMVAIVDPHIKKADSFRIYSDAKDLDILIKKPDGTTNFEGWCWTGSSVWVDFFNPKSWDWWTRMFTFGVWKDSTKWLFIWNDMNEPSVFDGPEISVPRGTKHFGGWENRDVHNINGMLFHNQTSQALIARESPAQRPFVLSRSFFAGSQRFGAIWTGDNLGTWDHFAGETAMILSNNIAGMSFCGADVGGFFGNPSTELLVRWYQAGAFMPFFRAHAHIDTKRREPYLYEEPIRGYIRDAVRLRYQLLQVWYNAFHDASVWGLPIIRPQYAVFPEDEAGFAIDDQYYIGDSGLLFKPVTKEGAETTSVYISDNQPYYDFSTDHLYPAGPSRELTIATPLSTFPLLLQGGNILPIRQRVRRASPLMWQDPYSLTIALDRDYTARGQLYSDDGVGYGHEQGEYVWKEYAFEWSQGVSDRRAFGKLTSARHSKDRGSGQDGGENEWAKKIAHVEVEQIVILGIPADRPVKAALVRVGKQEILHAVVHMQGVHADSKEEGTAGVVVLKLPKVKVVDDWEIEFM